MVTEYLLTLSMLIKMYEAELPYFRASSHTILYAETELWNF